MCINKTRKKTKLLYNWYSSAHPIFLWSAELEHCPQIGQDCGPALVRILLFEGTRFFVPLSEVRHGFVKRLHEGNQQDFYYSTILKVLYMYNMHSKPRLHNA